MCQRSRGVLAAVLLAASLALAGCAAGFPPAGAGSASSGGEPGAEPGGVADALDGALFPARDDEARTLLLRGEEALIRGRLEEAADLFAQAVGKAAKADLAAARRALADSLLALRRPEKAERLYREALADPFTPAVWRATLHSNLAAACYRRGTRGAGRAAAEAREAAEAALRIDPASAEALKTLGLVDLLEGQTGRGAERLRAALRANPRIPEAIAALAAVEAGAGDHRSAIRRYEELLELLPQALESDHNRRWKDLFHPETTEEALGRRLARLRDAAGGRGAPAEPKGERASQ